MVSNLAYVFRILVIETVIVHTFGGITKEFRVPSVYVVDLFIVQYLGPLMVQEVLGVVEQDVTRI